MIRKVLIALLSLVCIVACAFGLSACGFLIGNPDNNQTENPPENPPDNTPVNPSGEYTVIYDANGGKFGNEESELDDGTVVSQDGTKMTLTTLRSYLIYPLKSPTRDKYAFSGWAKDKDGETLWDFDNDRLTGNITLYAVWTVTFDYKLSDDGSYYIVRGIGGLSGDLEIPETYNGKPVTEIAENAFKNESKLTGIIIPDSVTTIGKAAFMRCNNLLSVSVGEGVTVLPEQVFLECGKLETITIPKSVTEFEECAFGELADDCTLTEVHYGGSADDWCGIVMKEYIILNQGVNEPANPLANGKAKLFIDGQAVTDITINTEKINCYAFYGCKTIESVTFGNNVKEIDYRAFYNSGFKTISFANYSKLTTIGQRAFYGSDIQSLTLPNSLESIPSEAFANCSKLTSVALGGVKYVSESAFENCYALKDLDLGNAEELGNSAFASCEDALTSVTIPATVWYIGSSCFSFCSKLNSVTFANNENSAGWYVTRTGNTTTLSSDAISTPSAAAARLKDNGEWVRIAGELQFSEINNGASYSVSGLSNANKGSIVIPSQYNGKPVTRIARAAFQYSELTNVIIPNSVISIYDDAFFYCSSLKSVIIPDSVFDIEHRAFKGCDSLESIVIGKGLSSIGIDAFYGCPFKNINYTGDISSWVKINGLQYLMNNSSNKKLYFNGTELTDLVIPNDVTSIASSAFYGCTSLTSVTIPDSVTSIGNSAFANTAWYNNQPDGIIYAGKIAYKYKGNMPANTSITIKDGTKIIADSAFRGCTSLTSIIIPDSVTSIEEYAFYGCTSLTGITIPNSVTSIGSHAFDGCTSLTSITIPDSVTSIGAGAFRGCTSLSSVTIPNLVTSIGSSAFSGCSSLENIYYTGNISSWLKISGLDNLMNSSSNKKLYFNGTELTELVIPDDVTSIASYAFSKCTSLTSVTIPNSVTSIGRSAFYGCTSLTSVTIPDSVTSIGEGAFRSCTSLTSVTIPNSVTSIGESAFNGCSSLTSITIPNSVTSIGSHAFNGCSSLTSITIPNSVTSIGSHTFLGCNSLSSITIPDSVTSIGNYAFHNCSSLVDINFNGTKEQWLAITKDSLWDEITGKYTVHCTNGDISKS